MSSAPPPDRIVTYRPFGTWFALLALAVLASAFSEVPPGVHVICRNAAPATEDSPTIFRCDESQTLPGLGPVYFRRSHMPGKGKLGFDQSRDADTEPLLLAADVERAARRRESSFEGTTPWSPLLARLALAAALLALAFAGPFAWRLTFSEERDAFVAISPWRRVRAERKDVAVRLVPRRLGRTAIVIHTDNPFAPCTLRAGWLTGRDRRFLAEVRTLLEQKAKRE